MAVTQRRRTRKVGIEEVFALEERIGELEAKLREMANEVRTRRVIVEEPDGFERVRISGYDGIFSPGVRVFARVDGAIDSWTYSALYGMDGTGEQSESRQASVGVMLWGEGNGRGDLSIDQDLEGQWSTSLTLEDRDGWPGMVLDGNGLKMHPHRQKRRGDSAT